MNTLKKIQIIAKIGKIISTIVFICCIVGVCGCVVGIASLSAAEKLVAENGITLRSIVESQYDYRYESLYAVMSVGLILCAGEIILSKFAQMYFSRELDDGTPFTLSGANKLFRLGILTICIPLGTQILAQIVYKSFQQYLGELPPMDFSNTISFSLGIMFLIMSLVCKYGAELHSSLPTAEQSDHNAIL